jgi:hypothetical protein
VWGNQAPDDLNRFTGPSFNGAYRQRIEPEEMLLLERKTA